MSKHDDTDAQPLRGPAVDARPWRMRLAEMYGSYPVPDWHMRLCESYERQAEWQAQWRAEMAAKRAQWAITPPQCTGCGRKFKTDRTLATLRQTLPHYTLRRAYGLPTDYDATLDAILCRRCREAALQRVCPKCGASFRVQCTWLLCLDCLCRERASDHRWVRERLQRHVADARRAELPATLTLDEWLVTLEHFRWRCAYCGKWPYESLDHFIPSTQGGGTTAYNCVPACVRCNSYKGTRKPEECIEYDTCTPEAIERIRTYLATRVAV